MPSLLNWAGRALLGAGALAAVWAPCARAADVLVPALPPAVHAALAQAGVPDDAMSAVVVPLSASGERLLPRLSVQAGRVMQAASVMKLFTTYAALDQLGPAWTWKTPVELGGPVSKGVLRGPLVIHGQGDPSLVIERWWLLLKQVRDLGVREIRGDIVLDQSAFRVPTENPADFDGEPLKPYNVLPRALVVNFQSVSLRLRPDADGRNASLSVQPSLAGVRWPERVKLQGSACGDWRAGLQIDLSKPTRPTFKGYYPASCGEREWELAWPNDAAYGPRVVEALWRELGGKLRGQAVERNEAPDAAAATVSAAFEFASLPLHEVVRNINKFSNNLMARQLFLTLGLNRGEGSIERAREAVASTAKARAACNADELVLDNGSGLSRTERTSAACLARLLQAAWAGPVMPELLASMPVVGVDGTTAKRTADGVGSALARAHIKTGSLKDVAAIGGVVLADSGRRYVVVALINHPNANAARSALDAMLRWSAEDTAR
jgi:D-alanyl-D-alanine carboxypeptidase/D-alanyl-D-alanine-endopeptidase (penicillin-binding protein 4)